MRVFLDANVLFTAAHNPDGKAAFIIELGVAGHFLLFTSDAALIEAERNLAAKYPHSLPFLESLTNHMTLVTADLSVGFPDGLPRSDAVIFQAALTCRATHFLTGDLRHFGPIINRPDATFSITIQTVAQFLSEMWRCPGGSHCPEKPNDLLVGARGIPGDFQTHYPQGRDWLRGQSR
ncbi:MAG: PIN domain-containing protein [Syntrophobacteraceae bacterium]